VTIEDINGTFDAMAFSKVLDKYKDILVEDELITIKGKLSIRDGKSPIVLIESVIPWQKKEDENVEAPKKIYLRFNTKDLSIYNKVKSIILSYPGESQVIIKCTQSNEVFTFNAKVNVNNYLNNELVGLIGESNVVVKD
jgi:DNA polymerase-3 subunit alpha